MMTNQSDSNTQPADEQESATLIIRNLFETKKIKKDIGAAHLAAIRNNLAKWSKANYNLTDSYNLTDRVIGNILIGVNLSLNEEEVDRSLAFLEEDGVINRRLDENGVMRMYVNENMDCLNFV